MSGPLLDRLLGALRGKKGPAATALDEAARTGKEISYEEARELARHKDPRVRKELAARSDVRPEILYYLAEDPDPVVRREIANNHASPAQADLRLAADADPSVRGDLAQKIARLAPGLSADEQDRLRRMTYEALNLLARDQITRVRQILAEALKDVANAPPELVRALAHDSALEVAGPVLEFSPVLSDDDLLEIIQSCPMGGALQFISRRATVNAPVADAIARTDDIDAIAILLGNPSAQIREETLDMLLDRAPEHDAWHDPLVRRPQLSARAATKLARFVAESLLQVLDDRPDLDAETKAAVAAVVRRRVEDGGADMGDFRRPEAGAAHVESVDDNPLQSAQRMYAAGRLEEPVMLAALAANDTDFVLAALAVRAGVSLELVQKIVSTQSAKGLTALAWQAGLSMAAAVQTQTKLAKIAPTDVLRPRVGSQAFPLSAEEMSWQIEFFSTMAGEAKPVMGK
jgi:uncharacterized protein (DUF2336 family)